jgi:hypothetical protein
VAVGHCQGNSRYCDEASTIQFHLRGANANYFPAISSCSSLLFTALDHRQSDSRYLMTLRRFNSIYGELMQIICQQLAPAHPYCSRFSVITKAILATVMTLPQINSIYGELMQIICRQLAPAHPYCSRFSVITKAILATVMTLPQINSIYGELMQIICRQLAPAQSYCAVRGLSASPR